MQTVVHEYKRGAYVTFVKDDGPNFGYSSRVAYAMGLDKPRYRVPAIYDPDVIANRWVHRGYVQAWLNDNISQH